jgi:hypothetical protein
MRKRLAQLVPVGFCSAGNLPEHFLTARRFELANLRCHALAVSRYPGIAVNHARTMHRNFATKKSASCLDFILVHQKVDSGSHAPEAVPDAASEVRGLKGGFFRYS